MRCATGVEKANRMAEEAQARVMGIVAAAQEMGAVPPPRAGEPLPESLRGGPEKNPDPLDLPAGLHPVGSRPAGMPDLLLPGEKLPVGMQGRAAVEAVIEAAREAGLHGGRHNMRVQPVPEAASVMEYAMDGDTLPGMVRCYLTGHSREAIREGMIQAIMQAAHDETYRPTSRFGFWMDEDRRARWDEIVERGPQTEGLRSKLASAAEAGDTPGGHIGRWFQRIAGHIAEAAYDAGVPVAIFGLATRPSGFQVRWSEALPTQIAQDPASLRLAGAPACYLDPHAYEPSEFVEHVIDTVLYGNLIEEDTEEHSRLSRALWAAAVARFTPIPDAPPLD